MTVQTSNMERGWPPAETMGGRTGELAPVVLLDPSQAEEGLSFEPVYKSLLAADPLSVVGGLWRGVSQVKSRLLGEMPGHSNPVPQRVTLTHNKHDHLFLVTEPDPETGVDPDEAPNSIFKLGLMQLADVGSSLRLHVAYARQHPDQRVITEATRDMSHTGKADGSTDRHIDAMAGESLQLLAYLIRNGGAKLRATSLNTRSILSMAEQNLAANHKDKLDITGLTFIAPAIIASAVEGEENFRDPDIDEDDYREGLSKEFQLHVAEDFLYMLATHTRDVVSCWPDIAAYVMAPHKLRGRARAIAADYDSVREGTPWEMLKHVVSAMDVEFVGGGRDPLVREQIPQLDMLDRLSPGRIRRRIIPHLGHLMTAAAEETVGHLDMVESEATPLAIAA